MADEACRPEFHWIDGVPTLQFLENRLLRLDFEKDPRYHRRLRGKNELLAKAVGLKSGAQSATQPFHVWDLSLGLAEDAWTLARLGCQVRGFEREPLLFRLVSESLTLFRSQLATDSKLRPAAERLTVNHADAMTAIANLALLRDSRPEELPQVLYFDPMYAGATKSSALPRLEMQLLRAWLGEDEDQELVLAAALKIPGLRIVVKRAVKAPILIGPVSHSFYGEKVRYDMYQTRSLAT